VSWAWPAEAAALAAVRVGLSALPWNRSLAVGAALGDVARRLGVRRAVAEDNLARALPELDAGARAAVLAACYREVGRVAVEYPRLPQLARAPAGRVVKEVVGTEHVRRALDAGRGVVLVSAHFGNFELFAAAVAVRLGVPISVIVQPQSNPWVDRWLNDLRARAGLGIIPLGAGLRGAIAALRANRGVALVADQDARRRGLFVPFFGRLASTPRGPAELAVRTGAPIVMGFTVRGEDGRHAPTLLPPLEADRGAHPEREVERLTLAQVAVLEEWVRRHPDHWFWMHRRWKTPPREG
jgi:KDO2-lipid IV(A) lauroyltransferase